MKNYLSKIIIFLIMNFLILYLYIMLWKDKFDNWLNGEILQYPNYINQSFIWRTNKIMKDENNKYYDEFIQ